MHHVIVRHPTCNQIAWIASWAHFCAYLLSYESSGLVCHFSLPLTSGYPREILFPLNVLIQHMPSTAAHQTIQCSQVSYLTFKITQLYEANTTLVKESHALVMWSYTALIWHVEYAFMHYQGIVCPAKPVWYIAFIRACIYSCRYTSFWDNHSSRNKNPSVWSAI